MSHARWSIRSSVGAKGEPPWKEGTKAEVEGNEERRGGGREWEGRNSRRSEKERERERWIDRERERETIYGIKGPEQRGMKRDV